MAVRKRIKPTGEDDSIATGDLESVRKSITEVNLEHPTPKSRGLTQQELMQVVGDGAIEIARKHRKDVHTGQLPLDFNQENTMAQAKKKVTKKAAPKEDTGGGQVTLAQLAEELGITPSVARRKLRTLLGESREEKTRYVWKEGSKDLEKVRKHLTVEA